MDAVIAFITRPDMALTVKLVLAAIVGSAKRDYSAYKEQQKLDPALKFSWKVAAKHAAWAAGFSSTTTRCPMMSPDELSSGTPTYASACMRLMASFSGKNFCKLSG